MLVWTGPVLAIMLIGLLSAWGWRLRGRRTYYQELAARRPVLCQGCGPVLQVQADSQNLAEIFNKEFLIRVADFLDEPSLKRLQEEGLANIERGIRNYVPLHKKGRSLPHETLYYHAPGCLAFYHSPAVLEWIGRVVGETVFPAADHDQSACSLLIYDQPGDHIGWHYDHNYYRGRQFTVLLSLVNKDAGGGLSSSTYQRKLPDGQVEDVDTQENALVVFEGARVLHRATATRPGDLRIMLSMTFNTEPKIHWFAEFIRRIKDTAFHGWKAIWD